MAKKEVNQNILDFIIQNYGTLDNGLKDFLLNNDMDDFRFSTAGTKQVITNVKSNDELIIYKANNVKVSTGDIDVNGDFNNDFNTDFLT